VELNVNARRSIRQSLAVLVALAATVVLASCGVPATPSPQAIAKSQVPFHLLAPEPPTTTTTQPTTNLVPVKIYLINSAQAPAPVERDVLYPAPLDVVLSDLLAGPTNAESARGYSTALSVQTRIRSATTSPGVATVNFNTAFGQISGSAQVLAVAQVVFTVASLEGVATGVVFEIDGKRVQVPIATGAQVSGPVYVWEVISQPGS
jgi:spore germination protein GerM